MLTVVFGAGASHDVASKLGANRELRLPLASDLFSDRFAGTLRRHQPVQVLASRLDRSRHNGVVLPIERALGQLLAEAENDSVLRGQLYSAREYLQEAISRAADAAWDGLSGRTNYLAMVDEARRWGLRTSTEVAFVTFNYDDLLDRACEGQGMGWAFNRMDDYTARSDMRLYKVHGSTSWDRFIPVTDPTGQRSIEEAAQALAEAPKEFRHRNEPFESIGFTAPAIAIPIDQKYEFECPPAHIGCLTEDLRRTTHLLLIGWRASEPHFGDLVRDNLPAKAKVGVVSLGQDGLQEVARNLQPLGIKLPRATAYGGGFSSFVQLNGLDRFLKSGEIEQLQ